MADLNSIAESMGIPAELVSRSAEARAAEMGSTAEEVLEAWGGGDAVAPAPKEEPTPDSEPSADEVDSSEEAATEPAEEPTPPPPREIPVDTTPEAPAPVATGPTSTKPPVLVGSSDNPWAIVAGAAALFLAVALLGLFGPSVVGDNPGTRTSEIGFSEDAEHGRALYGSLGCAACHTQMIRPVVADVGIGPVTLSDTNQVLGVRRFGPDLSDVGSRVSATQLEAIVDGTGGHPSHDLSSEDMSDLVAYLLESSVSVGGGS